MRLTKLHIRFFKSFNYDYERKSNPDATECDWENLDGAWFPYVTIDLEPSITTIVGANESGKSHLLTAVEKLIQGTDIGASDFCRYSRLFSVQQGQRRAPDLAGDFTVSTPRDVELIKEHLDLDLQAGAVFRLLRESGAPPRIAVLGKDAPQPSNPEIEEQSLQKFLPRVFRIDANVPLPVSIPLHHLVGTIEEPPGSRASRSRLVQAVLGRGWTDQNELAQVLPELFTIVSDDSSSQDNRYLERQYELGRSLLFNVANIDTTTFTDLADAIAAGNEGYANGLLQSINDSLASHLNFPRWWAQDREFRLMVSPREHDLVFTIRDRTGTEYSFAERSSGLRYFLSYHVQLLAHQPPEDGRSEILLMDEPDAFLSNQGQQDLLRVLEMFSCPEDGIRQDQLIYVTHSPFLINRNAAERVRVLEKGIAEEGTRVVSDVARNHYEPLRSALGTFVAETSFIGGSNLFVEGLSDQVLLAGLNSYLLRSGAPPTTLLDLNEVTIVPSGSASHVPYLVYLARGRDVVRPPCVVLLDSDKAGNDAAKALARGGPRRKELVAPEYVIQIGASAQCGSLQSDEGVVLRQIEDLIPISLATEAAQNYAVKVFALSDEEAGQLTDADVNARLKTSKGSVFGAVASAVSEKLGDDIRLEKVGFAREIVAILMKSPAADQADAGIKALIERLRPLLEQLAIRLREAHRAEQERRWSNRVGRTIDAFLKDHPTTTKREWGKVLVEEIEASLDSSLEGDEVRKRILDLRRDFELDQDLTEPIERYPEFRNRVAALRYGERFAKQRFHGDRTDAKAQRTDTDGSESPENPGPDGVA